MFINTSYAFWMLLERVMRLISGFCIYLMFAKYFSVKDFGVLNLFLAIISIFSSIISFGADQYNLHEINKNKNKIGLLNEIIFSRFIMYLASIFILYLLKINYKEIDNFFFIVAMILITNIFLVYSQFIQSLGMFILFSKISTISLFFGFFLKLYFLFTNKGVIYFFYSILIENLMLVILMGFFVYEYIGRNYIEEFFKIDMKNLKKYFKVCFPLMLASLMVTIYFKIEIILISRFLGGIDAGYWGVLLLTLSPWYMLCSAITPIVNHELSKYEFNSVEYNKYLNKCFKYYIYLSIFGILLNILVVKFLLLKFIGFSYLGAINISLISSLAILPIFLGSLQDVSIAHRGKTKIVLNKLIFGLPFSIILFVFLIYHYSLIGGAISLVISYYVTSILFNFFFDRYFFNHTFAAIYGRDRWKKV